MDKLDEKFRRARKEHRCNLCGRTIERGKEYLYRVFADGVTIHDDKTCMQCFHLFLLYDRFLNVEFEPGLFDDMVHGLSQEEDCAGNNTIERVNNLLKKSSKKLAQMQLRDLKETYGGLS